MASEYTTRVSGGFRQAGNNVALSRALLSVGTLIRAPGRPALIRRSPSGFFSSNSILRSSAQPRGVVTAITLALSYRSCRPNAPFAVLVCLSKSSVAEEYYSERSGNRWGS